VTRIAKKATLTEKQGAVLKELVTSRTHRSDHRIRAHIVLLSAESKSNIQISEELGTSLSTVKKWRSRWLKNEARLLLIDEKEKGITYVRKILEILNDEQRPGAPCVFTAEQICQIMSVACERPEDSGLPISHWSLNSLVNEVIRRGIVERISRSQLAVFLKSRRHQTS
jgi:putative transposase